VSDRIHEPLIGLHILFVKARNDLSEVLVVELLILVYRAGQEALTERTEWNKANTQLFQRRKNLFFRLTPPQGILAFNRGNPLNTMRLANRLGSGLGQAKVFDLAFGNQLFNGAGDFFDRHLRIYAVLIEQIDDIGTEALKRGIDILSNVIGLAVHSYLLALGIEVKTELRCDHHLVTKGFQSLADKFLVGVWAVCLGGVEKSDATLVSRSYQRHGL